MAPNLGGDAGVAEFDALEPENSAYPAIRDHLRPPIANRIYSRTGYTRARGAPNGTS